MMPERYGQSLKKSSILTHGPPNALTASSSGSKLVSKLSSGDFKVEAYQCGSSHHHHSLYKKSMLFFFQAAPSDALL